MRGAREEWIRGACELGQGVARDQWCTILHFAGQMVKRAAKKVRDVVGRRVRAGEGPAFRLSRVTTDCFEPAVTLLRTASDRLSLRHMGEFAEIAEYDSREGARLHAAQAELCDGVRALAGLVEAGWSSLCEIEEKVWQELCASASAKVAEQYGFTQMIPRGATPSSQSTRSVHKASKELTPLIRELAILLAHFGTREWVEWLFAWSAHRSTHAAWDRQIAVARALPLIGNIGAASQAFSRTRPEDSMRWFVQRAIQLGEFCQGTGSTFEHEVLPRFAALGLIGSVKEVPSSTVFLEAHEGKIVWLAEQSHEGVRASWMRAHAICRGI